MSSRTAARSSLHVGAGTRAVARHLASPRLTVAGFVALGGVAAATLFSARVGDVWLVLPLALLWLNLLAAIAAHPALRRGGLFVFHAALACALVLVALGRLLHFDGRVEVTTGSELDAGAIEVTSIGPWHGQAWRTLSFQQGAIAVDYAPGRKRARTASEVVLADGRGASVGDTVALVLDGYHFYTTHNKGYAALVAVEPRNGAAQRGALHLPSYPLLDWKQEQTWRAPDGTVMRFWLRPDAVPPDAAAWRFEPARGSGTLVVEVPGQRAELRAGEVIDVPFGRLRFDGVGGWMGYRISHDATLPPLFGCALIGLVGLAWHLLRAAGGVRLRVRPAEPGR